VFTATKDVLLPTTVTGSWPRPRWYTARMGGRPLSTCVKDVVFREQLTDALAVVLSDQTRAGLDILTHGDYFHDEDLGGHSWHRYPLERWSGLEGDFVAGEWLAEDTLAEYPPGTILHEVFGGWAWPAVVGKVEPNELAPLEYAKIWRLAQARTTKPVKFGTVSAQGIHHFLDIRTDLYSDDRHELIWDLATAMNKELRELAAAGCTVIQVEEPLLHFLACYHPEQGELIDFLVDAFNHEVDGLEDVEVWVHTCWGNPNMQRAAENPSYANSIEIYLDRLNADVWTIELKDGDHSVLELFEPYKGRMPKKLAIGVVSHRALQVETAEEIADLTREALRHIDVEDVILSSDCGFGRQGANRLIAFYKAVAVARGANLVRQELGLEERYVPAADPALQPDVPTEPAPKGAG
jgi:5-methyltetrahydropteroyltriglutamate--homocysteine methyltransferase